LRLEERPERGGDGGWMATCESRNRDLTYVGMCVRILETMMLNERQGKTYAFPRPNIVRQLPVR